ncbi:Integrase [Theobroma cacao]|nr:Integrase [Theobroma cacao]
MSKLIRKNLVVGLPDLKFENDKICDACQLGKQVRTSFKTKKVVSTSRPLKLMHIDLFGSVSTTSLGGNSYGFVIVDDYFRYTWVYFLAHKNYALPAFISHCRKVENEKGLSIVSIRSDHGGEFKRDEFENFCNEKGSDHNFSAPRTPQQNGVIERKNQTLKEMARTMLCENNLPKYFWVKAINTAAYILNRVSIRAMISKTPYELYKGRKLNISHLRSFGCKCFVLNNGKQPLGKFDAKSDEAMFLGYALNSKAYRVFNKRSLTIEEYLLVVFDESNTLQKEISNDEHDTDDLEKQMEEMSLDDKKNSEENSLGRETRPLPIKTLQRTKNHNNDLPRSWRYAKDHPQELIIGDISQGVKTRRATRETCEFSAFISQIKSKTFEEAEKEESWILAMQEELDQFKRNHVWSLVSKPINHPIVGTKWVFRNKVDKQGNVVRNKAWLVAQGYNQEERIDYDETFAPVARIKAIRLLLAFACFMNFKLFQMDVKSVFLNGFIQEEVYVEQHPSFEDFEKSNHVFKLHKALCGLKQAPRALYQKLSKFLVEKSYVRGNFDTTLFIKRYLNDLIVVQIYVDDIVFCATNEALCKNFAKEMQGEFEMSMMGELKYFLAFQIKQSEKGIFINQERYTQNMLKRFDMLKLKSICKPISPSTRLDLDEKRKDVDQKLFRDFAGSKIDRKSTSGTCQFLGSMIVSWSSKKQNSVALSAVEAEYVSLSSCCAQILWIKQQLKDYGISMHNILIYCDNTSAINISKNPVQHSRTKHIEIRHHFVRDHVVKGDIKIEFVNTLQQLADIFTKPLNEERFCEIRRNLEMKGKGLKVLLSKGRVMNLKWISQETPPNLSLKRKLSPEQGTKVIGSLDENPSSHPEPEKEQPSPSNSEKLSIMDVFNQMVREEQAEKEAAKAQV